MGNGWSAYKSASGWSIGMGGGGKLKPDADADDSRAGVFLWSRKDKGVVVVLAGREE